jgi:hypothetical protein
MSENWGILHPLIAFGIMILFLLPGNALLFVIGCQVALVYIGYHVSKRNSSASPTPHSTDPRA